VIYARVHSWNESILVILTFRFNIIKPLFGGFMFIYITRQPLRHNTKLFICFNNSRRVCILMNKFHECSFTFDSH
jgi:hypothetical protein